MRLIIILYIFLSFISPAQAYIEEDNTGRAEASAGDQNTNMHRLNARGDYYIKKLKKIDEFVSKGNDISSLDISNVDDLNNFEQKDREEQYNKKLLAEVVKTTSNPATLKENTKPDLYASLAAINETRDTEIAAALQRQFRGRTR